MHPTYRCSTTTHRTAASSRSAWAADSGRAHWTTWSTIVSSPSGTALSQNDYNSYAIVTVEDLIEVAGTVGTAIDKSKRGWQLTLPASQKVLATSTTFNNEVFFVAFSPDNAAAASCSAGLGRNFLYRVSVINGDPIVNNRDNVVPGTEHRLRVRELAQGGIAPSPRFLFPSPDPGCTGDECAPPPPLGCIGVQCFDPGFANNPVRTLWTQK